MKKEGVLLVLSIFLISFMISYVIAAQSLAALYCKDKGHTVTEIENKSYCVFADGTKCEEWTYYRGECLAPTTKQIQETTCTNAGEQKKSGSCCEGLTALSNDRPKENGVCETIISGWQTCSDCGNDVCESWENKCNCIADCKNASPVTNTPEEKSSITFLPGQKRDESYCIGGCKCVGAVISCETEDGKLMSITAGASGNTITISSGSKEATTKLEIKQDRTDINKTKISAKLSNGKFSEIKVMPDAASERAIGRLELKVCSSENNCTIELKEVGKKDDARPAYEIQIERHSRILGIFQTKMKIKTQVNADSGIVEKVMKPWWAFIATEPAEE